MRVLAAQPPPRRRGVLPLLLLCAFLVSGGLAVLPAHTLDDFDRPDALVTNEWAYWNPDAPGAVRSRVWEVTSGSLFVRGQAGWTGNPDGARADADSRAATDSAVFRVVTHSRDIRDGAVSFALRVRRFVHTPRTPARRWDGVNLFLRYQSEYNLYSVSVCRRDHTLAIKKKVTGGPSNGGTYHVLAVGSLPPVLGAWQRFRATIRNQPDGAVVIHLYRDGRLLLWARDAGAGGVPPIRQAGRVGFRGDNADFEFDDVVVSPD
jgi:hypothetical protein